MDKKQPEEKVQLPDGITAKYEIAVLTIKGPKGEVAKKLLSPGVKISANGADINLSAKKNNQKSKKIMGTIKAHVRNMVKGVIENHSYRMKICSGHFPMTVTVTGNELIVKNFFGEKSPRKVRINPLVNVKIDGQDILIESADKDAAAQTAASIEQSCKRSNFDRRIFMDGIYITNKDGKELK